MFFSQCLDVAVVGGLQDILGLLDLACTQQATGHFDFDVSSIQAGVVSQKRSQCHNGPLVALDGLADMTLLAGNIPLLLQAQNLAQLLQRCVIL